MTSVEYAGIIRDCHAAVQFGLSCYRVHDDILHACIPPCSSFANVQLAKAVWQMYACPHSGYCSIFSGVKSADNMLCSTALYMTQSEAGLLALAALRSTMLKCQAANHNLLCLLQVEHVWPRSISHQFARMAAIQLSPDHHSKELEINSSTPLQHSQHLTEGLLPILSHYLSQSATAFAILRAAEQIGIQYKAQLAASLSDAAALHQKRLAAELQAARLQLESAHDDSMHQLNIQHLAELEEMAQHVSVMSEAVQEMKQQRDMLERGFAHITRQRDEYEGRYLDMMRQRDTCRDALVAAEAVLADQVPLLSPSQGRLS